MQARQHPARVVAVALVTGAIIAAGGVARGHDPPGAQVTTLTERIAAEPSNAALHVARGDLLLVEERWLDALADYDRAIALGIGDAPAVHRRRAEALLGAGVAGHALVASELALVGDAASGPARLLRRALHRLQHFDEAARDYDRALRALSDPRPEHLLEHARALAAIGTPTATARAIAVLDAGAARLGGPVALELAALELEIELARWDDALARIDELAARARRRERWLLRRAAILEQVGRCREAMEACAAALDAIEALPARHRATRATSRIEADARGCLAYLTAVEADRGSDMRLSRQP